jgi:hypothetical protein
VKKLLLALAALATLPLAGCDNNRGTDGYTCDKKEYTRETQLLTVVLHPDIRHLRHSYTVLVTGKSVFADPNLMAYSLLTPDSCEVHIVDPGKSYKPEWIGHELVHCLHGRWHP